MKFSIPHRQALFLVSAAALMLMASAPADAMIISATATGGSTGDLIVNNACTNEVDTGLTITGCLNSNHDSDVNFYSNKTTEVIEFGSGGGQATVNAIDGAMQTITIDPVFFELNELITDLDATADGWVQFCDNDGCWKDLFQLKGNGSNFFDIKFNPTAEYLTINTFSDEAGTSPAQLIADSLQWRVGVTPIPEPFTMSLVGAGIVGAFALRRRKAKA
jgi:hypothetical protein